jgi:hypothetical protein
MFASRGDLVSLGLLFLLVFSSLRPAFKYLKGLPEFLAFALLVLSLLLLWISRRSIGSFLRALSRSGYFQILLILMMGVVTAIFYPMADALKYQGLGQDQDDCLIQGSLALAAGKSPYEETTYFGNPCSPLFGAIVPYVPFVLLGVFALAGPVILGATAAAVHLARGPLVAGLTLSLLVATPLTLELLVNGSDFIWIGFGLVLLGLALGREFPFLTPSGNDLTAAALVGLLASTRVNMPILLGLYLVILASRRSKSGIVLFGFAASIALLPSFFIYLADPAGFTPFHLIGKGMLLFPGGSLFLLMFVGLGLLLTLRKFLHLGFRASNLVMLLVGSNVVPLSIADLIARGFDFGAWEGASYLMVVYPLVALQIATHFSSRFRTPIAIFEEPDRDSV